VGSHQSFPLAERVFFFTFDLSRGWLKNEGVNVVCNRLMPCEKNHISSPQVLQLLAGLKPDMGPLPDEYSVEKEFLRACARSQEAS